MANLDLSTFLRLNGARKIGIGTSFALPVVSRWGVTFVIVFYTRDTIQVRLFVCLYFAMYVGVSYLLRCRVVSDVCGVFVVVVFVLPYGCTCMLFWV